MTKSTPRIVPNPSKKGRLTLPDYDFITEHPETGMQCEVKIVRYCPPGKTYSLPISPDVAAQMAKDRMKNRLIRYLSKL